MRVHATTAAARARTGTSHSTLSDSSFVYTSKQTGVSGKVGSFNVGNSCIKYDSLGFIGLITFQSLTKMNDGFIIVKV